MFGGLLKSKLWLWAGAIMLGFTVFYLVRETLEKRQIDNEVSRLQHEIVDVEGKNQEILELINYYKTTEYKERQARSILGLAKPGEFVVSLPSKVAQSAETADGSAQKSHLREWWEYFFN